VAYAPVNLARLAGVEAGTLITPDVLAHLGTVRDLARPVKILGGGDAPHGITVHAHAFSRTAMDKLSAAGSTAQLINWPDGQPVEEAPPEPPTKPRKARARRARPPADEDESAEAPAVEADAGAASEGADQEDQPQDAEGDPA